MEIQASNSLFMKLGEGSVWEASSIRDGTLHLDYREFPHELCLRGRWEDLRSYAKKYSADAGAQTRHINQVRAFYEIPEATLWITFHADRMFWCFSRPDVRVLDDGTRVRQTVGGWSDRDVQGKLLSKNVLSGKLLATQHFQGTICAVGEHSYLLNKINARVQPEVLVAQQCFQSLMGAMIPIIKRLHHKDFEIFVDLLFRNAGWNRIGVTGETEKDIDLDLMSPITFERIAIQIKSKASKADFVAYKERFEPMAVYSKFYFVTHSPTSELADYAAVQANAPRLKFWGAAELAEYAVRNGLVGWLIDKAS